MTKTSDKKSKKQTIGTMTKMTKRSTPLIKGYLPLRVVIPSRGDTFLFVKQHHATPSLSLVEAKQNIENNSLFVCNVPFIPHVRTNVFLTSLFAKFGLVDKVTVVKNPRKTPSISKFEQDGSNTDNNSAVQRWKDMLVRAESFFSDYDVNDEGKFAHVRFNSSAEMRNALRIMQRISIAEDDVAGAEITSLELQQMISSSKSDKFQNSKSNTADDSQSENSSCNDETEKTEESSKGRVLRLVDRYQTSIIPRDALMDYCNAVMESFESAEEKARSTNKSLSEPDEDGFVTVTTNILSKMVGSKRELEVDGGMLRSNVEDGGRNVHKKKLRIRKKSSGADELQDFYRFQRRESRQKGLHDLRKRFEGDLAAVKKVREQKKYRPFQE